MIIENDIMKFARSYEIVHMKRYCIIVGVMYSRILVRGTILSKHMFLSLL